MLFYMFGEPEEPDGDAQFITITFKNVRFVRLVLSVSECTTLRLPTRAIFDLMLRYVCDIMTMAVDYHHCVSVLCHCASL